MLNGRVVLSSVFLAPYHTQYTLLNARFTPVLFAFHIVIVEISVTLCRIITNEVPTSLSGRIVYLHTKARCIGCSKLLIGMCAGAIETVYSSSRYVEE